MAMATTWRPSTTRLHLGLQPGDRNASPKPPHRKHRPGEVTGKIHDTFLKQKKQPFFMRKSKMCKNLENDGTNVAKMQNRLEILFSSCWLLGPLALVAQPTKYKINQPQTGVESVE